MQAKVHVTVDEAAKGCYMLAASSTRAEFTMKDYYMLAASSYESTVCSDDYIQFLSPRTHSELANLI